MLPDGSPARPPSDQGDDFNEEMSSPAHRGKALADGVQAGGGPNFARSFHFMSLSSPAFTLGSSTQVSKKQPEDLSKHMSSCTPSVLTRDSAHCAPGENPPSSTCSAPRAPCHLTASPPLSLLTSAAAGASCCFSRGPGHCTAAPPTGCHSCNIPHGSSLTSFKCLFKTSFSVKPI